MHRHGGDPVSEAKCPLPATPQFTFPGLPSPVAVLWLDIAQPRLQGRK
jgi:hypothetical protein